MCESVMSTRGRILIAEDDAGVAELLVDVLGEAGYWVSTIVNGSDALAALYCERPDLALVDLYLPGMSGWEISAAMLAHGIDVPLIIMTAGRFSDDNRLAVGMCALLHKPFDLDDLLACVAQHVRQPVTCRSAELPTWPVTAEST
jgi:two-component system, response regulator, stage 0 sporulation protein F